MALNSFGCRDKYVEFFNGVNWPYVQPQTVAEANEVTGEKWREALYALNLTMEPINAGTLAGHAAVFKAGMMIAPLGLIGYLSAYANAIAADHVGQVYQGGIVISSSPPPSPFVFPPMGINSDTIVSTMLAAALTDWFKTGTVTYVVGFFSFSGNWL